MSSPSLDPKALAVFLQDICAFETGVPDAFALKARYDVDAFTPALFSAYDVLCPDRLRDAASNRQAEFLAGRRLAQHCLKHFSLPLTDIARHHGGAPKWPEGISGSISHSKGECICLMVNRPNCLPGIDVEGIADARALQAIQRKCLTATECDLVAHQTQIPVAHLATLIFSAKESLYKMLFPVVQQYFGFACAELVALPTAGCLKFKLTQDLHANLPSRRLFELNYRIFPTHVITWGAVWRQGGDIIAHP